MISEEMSPEMPSNPSSASRATSKRIGPELAPRQRLGIHHLSFYRAWMEGTMDLGSLADRYLETGDDLVAARRTLKAIERTLILACKRSNRPSSARLIRLDSGRLREMAEKPNGQDPETDSPSKAAAASFPSFEDYQAEVDPDGEWSYQELLEQYQSTYSEEIEAQAKAAQGAGGLKPGRRDRAISLIRRRNDLLIELSKIISETPKADHDIRGWLDESLSNRLAAAGLTSISSIIDYANQVGYGWFRHIPGLGPTKAEKVTGFLRRFAEDIGMELSQFALVPPQQLPKTKRGQRPGYLPPALRSAPKGATLPPPRPGESLVVDSGQTIGAIQTAFGPMKDGLFLPPEELDGSKGLNRIADERNRSGANNDFEAIQRWLATYCEPHQQNTERSYRKEAERLLLWVITEKGIPFSSMTTADVLEFREFLANPMPYERWVSTRTFPRFDPRWKPFVWRNLPRAKRALPGSTTSAEPASAPTPTKSSQLQPQETSRTSPSSAPEGKQAGLSAESIEQSLSVCRALCSWLVSQRYLDYNPFLGIGKKKSNLKTSVGRSFSRRQWALVIEKIESMLRDQPESVKVHRLNFALRLAYTTGLRLSEMVQCTTGDIAVVEDLESEVPEAYFLTVTGKGNEKRSVPLPAGTRKHLRAYLITRGLPGDPALCDPPTPLIAKIHKTSQGWHLSDAGLYTILSEFFDQIAFELNSRANPELNESLDARRFFQASTHWLRHTHGTHALLYGADLNIVKENMGHKSLSTTSLYVRPEKRLQIEQMAAFEKASEQHREKLR